MIPSPNDASLWWLRIVTVDPRYLDCLRPSICTLWLSFRFKRPQPSMLWVIDRDGDAYVLAVDRPTLLRSSLLSRRVVVENGVVQPCSNTTARNLYLYNQREKLYEERNVSPP